MMEGYDMTQIRKAIDNDDPFPEQKSALVAVRKQSMFVKLNTQESHPSGVNADVSGL